MIDRSDIEALRAKAKSKHDAAVADAAAEYQEALRSIEHVAKLIGEPAIALISPGFYGGGEAVPLRGPAELVRDAVAAIEEPFSTPTIFDWIVSKYGASAIEKPSISSVLNKLKDREIEVVEIAKGRSPAMYRRRGPSSASAAPKLLTHQKSESEGDE